MKKFKLKLLCMALAVTMAFSITGCGNSSKKEPIDEEIEYDEDGNPIEKEEEINTMLLPDSEVMITGLIAVMKDGNITTNGIWLTEEQVGKIAERYALGEYSYKKEKFKKADVKYVANMYDINNNLVSSMYLDKDINLCYENKYKISDPIMRGLFVDAVNLITDDSVLSMPDSGSNQTNPSTVTQNPQEDMSGNNTIALSKQAFTDAGFDDTTADVLAQSTFNLGIPVIKSAKSEANTILFTDVNDTKYTLSISSEGRIASIYNETLGEYVYSE